MKMISQQEVENYFTTVLEFSEWKNELEKNALNFLKQLIQRVGFHSYFHNIYMASVAPEHRRTPTLDEVIKIGLDDSGGVCIHQNAFMTILLREIGFETFMAGGNCMGSEQNDNHCMCIVKLPEKDGNKGTFLVDVGCGLPLDEAIPLDKLPYSGVSAGFRYEYRFCDETKEYQRWQLDGAFFKGKYDETKELLRYSFTLEAKEFSHFQNNSLVNIFTNPAKSIFLQNPFLFRSLDSNLDDKVNGRRFILIWGASMVIYDTLHRDVTHFSSYQEIKPQIMLHFPKIGKDSLDKAIGYFEKDPNGLVLGTAGIR